MIINQLKKKLISIKNIQHLPHRERKILQSVNLTFVCPCIVDIQGGSNMTGTDLCVNKCKQSRSYLNHLVFPS